MRLTDHIRLNSTTVKPAAMTLRDLQFKARSRGLTTLMRDIAAGGPGSGPRPGLGNLNDKELMIHHAMLERAGQTNDHTAQEIGRRQDLGAVQLSPKQWAKFSATMKTTHGMRLGNVPNYSQTGPSSSKKSTSPVPSPDARTQRPKGYFPSYEEAVRPGYTGPGSKPAVGSNQDVDDNRFGNLYKK